VDHVTAAEARAFADQFVAGLAAVVNLGWPLPLSRIRGGI
jgi:hypothetical protein